MLERLSFADSTIRRALVKEAQLLGFFYLTTFALLKNKSPKFIPLLSPPLLPTTVEGDKEGTVRFTEVEEEREENDDGEQNVSSLDSSK